MEEKCFTAGKWYKWVGPKQRPYGWNSEGEMNFMLDGELHQCNKTGEYKYSASFYDSNNSNRIWNWNYGFEYIVEYDPITNRSKLTDILLGDLEETI